MHAYTGPRLLSPLFLRLIVSFSRLPAALPSVSLCRCDTKQQFKFPSSVEIVRRVTSRINTLKGRGHKLTCQAADRDREGNGENPMPRPKKVPLSGNFSPPFACQIVSRSITLYIPILVTFLRRCIFRTADRAGHAGAFSKLTEIADSSLRVTDSKNFVVCSLCCYSISDIRT